MNSLVEKTLVYITSTVFTLHNYVNFITVRKKPTRSNTLEVLVLIRIFFNVHIMQRPEKKFEYFINKLGVF